MSLGFRNSEEMRLLLEHRAHSRESSEMRLKRSRELIRKGPMEEVDFVL